MILMIFYQQLLIKLPTKEGEIQIALGSSPPSLPFQYLSKMLARQIELVQQKNNLIPAADSEDAPFLKAIPPSKKKSHCQCHLVIQSEMENSGPGEGGGGHLGSCQTILQKCVTTALSSHPFGIMRAQGTLYTFYPVCVFPGNSISHSQHLVLLVPY